MNKSLLDTDTLSGIYKARDRALHATAERYLATFGCFSMSAVTVMEVVRGYCLAGSLQKLGDFLSGLANHEVYHFRSSTAELAGRIDADLWRTGQPIGREDPMIAATAIEQDFVLVSSNTSHYQRIQSLGYPLKLDDWRGATLK